MDRYKLLKMLITLSLIVVFAAGLMRIVRGNSMSLTEYARLNASSQGESTSPNPDGMSPGSGNNTDSSNTPAAGGSQSSGNSGETGNPHGTGNSSGSGNPSGTGNPSDTGNPVGAGNPSGTGNPGNGSASPTNPQDNGTSQLTGAALNGTSQLDQRVSLTDDFYYEPLSQNLRRYITGISYPATDSEEEAAALVVSYDDLRYVHVLHYDFDGNPVEGELICNEYIAQDLLEIFHELYYSEYQIERITLIDEYDGDDTASMEDNNTSCFNYRVVEGSSSLSKHAYGLAIDINPYYNPYVTYEKDGTEKVSPVAAMQYADRSINFPYKIDEDDLCCRLFKEHGFLWGGNWNSLKDYQHFQKTPK